MSLLIWYLLWLFFLHCVGVFKISNCCKSASETVGLPLLHCTLWILTRWLLPQWLLCSVCGGPMVRDKRLVVFQLSDCGIGELWKP